MLDSLGKNNGNGDGGLMEGANKCLLVTASSLDDNQDVLFFEQGGDEQGDSLAIVGELPHGIFIMGGDFEGFLGDINTDENRRASCHGNLLAYNEKCPG
jgi:hypothetical protein